MKGAAKADGAVLGVEVGRMQPQISGGITLGRKLGLSDGEATGAVVAPGWHVLPPLSLTQSYPGQQGDFLPQDWSIHSNLRAGWMLSHLLPAALHSPQSSSVEQEAPVLAELEEQVPSPAASHSLELSLQTSPGRQALSVKSQVPSPRQRLMVQPLLSSHCEDSVHCTHAPLSSRQNSSCKHGSETLWQPSEMSQTWGLQYRLWSQSKSDVQPVGWLQKSQASG
mmetsp:Transcript_28729/g.67451  ORF Transcript_28729/g.67451 Transcript_28729/m.67451 type:complete len:224 (+) Transcript_28729:161-832(+)